MNPERTIKITRKNADGKAEQVDVKMLYCAASETGYQSLSGKTMDVFFPTFEKDENGEIIVKEPAKATDMDYIQLSTACVVAAYECNNEEPPITANDIIYSASRAEIIDMIKTVLEMRAEWSAIPSTIEKEMEEKGDGQRKNGRTPTKRTKRS